MIDRESPSGSWRSILPFCRNIQILENASSVITNTDALTDALSFDPFHVHSDTESEGQNHGG